MPANKLAALYELFDQLVGMTVEERQRRLLELRNENHPLVDQLEGLMLFHQTDDPIDAVPSSFSEKLPVLQWLKSTTGSSEAISNAQDLRQLVGLFQWDQSQRHFIAGNYRIGKCLSFNSFSATYFAEDLALGRHAALLLTYPRWSEHPSNRRAFLSAVKLISSLFHPNVAAIFGLVEHDGLLGIARQWIPGIDLANWLQTNRDLEPQTIALIIQRIAEGLTAIHDAGVLHGDLKPANIVMRHGSIDPVIIDFGSAFSIPDPTNSSRSWRGGTRGYIAPEILQEQNVDHRLDFFSLGMILQDLLNSCRSSNEEFQRKQLDDLAKQLTSDDPSNRPKDGRTLIEQLTPLSGSLATSLSNSRFQWDSSSKSPVELWTRRTILASAVSLLPFVIGRTARTWVDEHRTTPTNFVPGRTADFRHFIPFRIQLEATTFIKHNDLKASDTSPRVFLKDYPNGALWYLDASHHRAVLISEVFQLPKKSVSHHWISFNACFDTLPGHAKCELWVQNQTLNSGWQLIDSRSNYFGGPIMRMVMGTMNTELLIPDSKILFQIVMTATNTADRDTTHAVAVRVPNTLADFAEVIALQLWYKEPVA